MLLCKDLAIKLVLSILFLSSTGNDNKSINAEHGFESSFATKNNIVSDVNQEHGTDSKVNKRSFCRSKHFQAVFSDSKEEQKFV